MISCSQSLYAVLSNESFISPTLLPYLLTPECVATFVPVPKPLIFQPLVKRRCRCRIRITYGRRAEMGAKEPFWAAMDSRAAGTAPGKALPTRASIRGPSGPSDLACAATQEGPQRQ